MDRFAIYQSLENDSDFSILKTKQFLNEKFLIYFNQFEDSEHLFAQNNHIVDSLYEYTNKIAHGFSLKGLSDVTFREYTNNYQYRLPNTLLAKCEEQLKMYCILSSLYTVFYLNSKVFESLSNLAHKYSFKKYITLDKHENECPFNIDTYEGSNHVAQERFRSNFDKLFKKISHSSICYLNDAASLNKSPQHRMINTFLDEFTYDLLINSMKDGGHIEYKLNSFYRHTSLANKRKQIRNAMKDLRIIDLNFSPSDTSDFVNFNLYNWKKEALFHIDKFKLISNVPNNSDILKFAEFLVEIPPVLSIQPFANLTLNALNSKCNMNNIEFLIRYIANITFPVFQHTFFISLFRYFNGSLEKMQKELISYIEYFPFNINNSSSFPTMEKANTNKIDVLGKCLQTTFSPYDKPFDSSFCINIENTGPDAPDLYYLQSTISCSYYKILFT